MKNLIRRKIKGSLRSVILLFPITIGFYIFFSDFGKLGNFIFLTKKLFIEISLGLLLVSFGYITRYVRWRIIINTFCFYPLAKMEFKYWLASYAFTATPGKIGEFIRCLFLLKIFDMPLKYSFFSILLERIFDLISVIIFISTFLMIKYKDLILTQEQNQLILFSFFLILFFLIKFRFVICRNLKYQIMLKKFKVFGRVINIKRFINLRNGRNLLKINILLKIIFLSLFSWGLEGVAFLLLLKKLNFDISFITATFIHTSAGLIGALTMIPGGLGLTELISISILKFQTIPINYGIPITAIMRIITLWYITLLGVISLLFIPKEVFNDS